MRMVKAATQRGFLLEGEVDCRALSSRQKPASTSGVHCNRKMSLDQILAEFSPTPCQWSARATVADPHPHRTTPPRAGIAGSVVDCIGHTPMVRLNRVVDEVKCEVLVKAEFLNPGGSVKDRSAARMIEDAEARGEITPGQTTLLEITSGNTGTGFGVVCAAKGYRCRILAFDSISKEKVRTMEALGCEVTSVPPGESLALAERIIAEDGNVKMLNQHTNASSPLAHFDGTAEELIEQCEGRIDYCFVGAGTGSTLTGISRKLKEKVPGVRVVGVNVEGSRLSGTPVFPTKVEGMGLDFLMRVCDLGCVDSWTVVNDKNALLTARRLIKEEGLLVGGSSGAVVWAALELGKTLPAGKRIVALLPDCAKNYLSKFIDDNWMIANGFQPAKVRRGIEPQQTLASLQLKDVTPVAKSTTCREAFEWLIEAGVPQLPVTEGNSIVGVVTPEALNESLLQGRAAAGDTVDKCMSSHFKEVPDTTSVAVLESLFAIFPCAFVRRDSRISAVLPTDLTRLLLTK